MAPLSVATTQDPGVPHVLLQAASDRGVKTHGYSLSVAPRRTGATRCPRSRSHSDRRSETRSALYGRGPNLPSLALIDV